MNERVGLFKVHYGRLCARYCNTDEAKTAPTLTADPPRPRTSTKHDDAAAAPLKNYETYPRPPSLRISLLERPLLSLPLLLQFFELRLW